MALKMLQIQGLDVESTVNTSIWWPHCTAKLSYQDLVGLIALKKDCKYQNVVKTPVKFP